MYMKRFIKKHKILFEILVILFFWRIYLIVIESVKHLVEVRTGYLGFISQANFDGVFYLAISEFWYRGLDQAFFPVYPSGIWIIHKVLHVSPAAGGLIVSILSLFLLLLFFYKLLSLDKPKFSVLWVLILFVSFPTSFFLAGVYTESLFIFLIILSFFLARLKFRFLSGLIGGLASGTRVVGIFILPSLFMEYYSQYKVDQQKRSVQKICKYFYPLFFVPLGLAIYMGYLYYQYDDPLLFVHIQPSFGAGRSGGDIILLPQVLFRYVKILLTVSPTTLTFFVSLLEFILFIAGMSILVIAYKKGVRRSYIFFSAAVLLFPTLSGTLSSVPRYILASFAIFIVLGMVNKYLKISIIIAGFVLQFILAVLFYQGYFIA